MILKGLNRNNSSMNNKNNSRTYIERNRVAGTQMIASITPLQYLDPFAEITPGSGEVDY